MTLDLSPYLTQIERIERASAALEASAKLMSPTKHHVQPVHVVYGGAHMFKPDTVQKLGRLATESFLAAAANPAELARRLGKSWSAHFAERVYQSTLAKLQSSTAVEDYRIDFEDGYGLRSNEEEDAHVAAAAANLVKAARGNSLPVRVGIRPKALSIATMKRSLRTLILFIEEFAHLGGKASGLTHLTVTLPKVTTAAEVQSLCEVLEVLETKHHLGTHFFGVELLIETPQALVAADGSIPLPTFIAAAKGRCTGVHFGVYDFTSSLGIGSAGQSLDHLTCDLARFLMQISANLAQGVSLSDGIINTLPIAPHKPKEAAVLTAEQTNANEDFLQKSWRLNFDQMLRSLKMGFYQGWDLHPSQVAIRHLVNRVYVFEEFENAAKRLKGFLDRSAQATRLGGTFDDRASVLGLVSFIERAVASGILKHADLASQGISLDELKDLGR